MPSAGSSGHAWMVSRTHATTGVYIGRRAVAALDASPLSRGVSASTGDRRMRMVWIAAVVVATIGAGHAQEHYPRKPMRWVVPYAAGGGSDAIVRPIAQKAGEVLGQSIIYENRGGAGGLIAGEIVAKADPDGYTFLVAAPNTHVF